MPREPLMTLEEKLNPKWTALVCIDYQNDFCAKGGALDECGFDVAPMAAVAPKLGRLIDEARDSGVPIIFVRNIYATDQGWYLSEVTHSQTMRTLRGQTPGLQPFDRRGRFRYNEVTRRVLQKHSLGIWQPGRP